MDFIQTKRFADFRMGTINSVKKGFSSVKKGFSSVKKGFSSVKKGFSSVKKGFSSVKKGFSSVKKGFSSKEANWDIELVRIMALIMDFMEVRENQEVSRVDTDFYLVILAINLIQAVVLAG